MKYRAVITYIGETSRSLHERAQICGRNGQHEERYCSPCTRLMVDCDLERVKMFEQHLWKRKIPEAISIRETKENNNRNVNQVWSPYIGFRKTCKPLSFIHLFISVIYSCYKFVPHSLPNLKSHAYAHTPYSSSITKFITMPT